MFRSSWVRPPVDSCMVCFICRWYRCTYNIPYCIYNCLPKDELYFIHCIQYFNWQL